MLTVLKEHHAALLAAMEEMRDLIAATELANDAVVLQRLKLNRASTARTRYLSDTVYPALLERLDGAEAADIRALRHDAAADRAAASSHIARWSSARLALDWHGFRHDAAAMLMMKERRIMRERSVLYRLLAEGAVAPPAIAPCSQRAA